MVKVPHSTIPIPLRKWLVSSSWWLPSWSDDSQLKVKAVSQARKKRKKKDFPVLLWYIKGGAGFKDPPMGRYKKAEKVDEVVKESSLTFAFYRSAFPPIFCFLIMMVIVLRLYSSCSIRPLYVRVSMVWLLPVDESHLAFCILHGRDILPWACLDPVESLAICIYTTYILENCAGRWAICPPLMYPTTTINDNASSPQGFGKSSKA